MSFVFVTSCFAFLLLALCYLLVDVLGVWTGTPFFQAGESCRCARQEKNLHGSLKSFLNILCMINILLNPSLIFSHLPRHEQHLLVCGTQRHLQPLPVALQHWPHEHPHQPPHRDALGHHTLGHHRPLSAPQKKILHRLGNFYLPLKSLFKVNNNSEVSYIRKPYIKINCNYLLKLLYKDIII